MLHHDDTEHSQVPTMNHKPPISSRLMGDRYSRDATHAVCCVHKCLRGIITVDKAAAAAAAAVVAPLPPRRRAAVCRSHNSNIFNVVCLYNCQPVLHITVETSREIGSTTYNINNIRWELLMWTVGTGWPLYFNARRQSFTRKTYSECIYNTRQIPI